MNKIAARAISTGSTALFLLMSGGALAHTGTGEPHVHGWMASLQAGVLHPFSGWDHLLAMLIVGAWAVAGLRRGRRVLAPLAFLGALALGGVLGMAGVAIPGGELAIAASVVVLAVLWGLGQRVAPAGGLALIAVAGLLHGHAHGAEMADGLFATGYAAGFLMGSAALHGLGWIAGRGLAETRSVLGEHARRLLAAGAGLAGLVMLAGRV